MIKISTVLGLLYLASWPVLCMADIQTELTDLLKKVPDFSGIVEVRQNDEIIAQEARGYANRQTKVPWSDQSVSTVGSITKQFTAAAIMKLVEQNRLETRAAIGDVIPDLNDSRFKGVTVHHLLTHSAGIPDVMRPDNTPFSRADVITHVKQAEPQFPAGSQFSYSNMGYSLLAAIVEWVSGQTYTEYLKTNLFEPAGIADSTGYDAARPKEALVHGYRRDDSHVGTMIDDIYIDNSPSWLLKGNGGMYSTNVDLHQWCMALHNGEVMAKPLAMQMWQPHIDETNGEGASFYGYGWVVFDTQSLGQVVAHNGDDAFSTMFSDFFCAPEVGVSVILRSNSLDYDQNVAAIAPTLLGVLSKMKSKD